MGLQSSASDRVLLITVVVFSIGELTQVRRARRRSRRADLRAEVVFRILFVMGVLMVPLSASVAPGARWPRGEAALVAAVVTAWSGLLLRWWAFRTLGEYFTLVLRTSSGQVVVDRGPYRVLRHPSYTGLLMAVSGCALMVGNWAGLLAGTTVVGAALVYRIRIEERALTDALGEQYLDFARNRARLVPFVW